MNASKAPSQKAPSWVGELQKDMNAALRRIQEIEAEKRHGLEVIQELQRQYQEMVNQAGRGTAQAMGIQSADTEGFILRTKLDKLTLKRHAVLTATLAGVGYQEIANITGWDVTTVKLQLRAALQVLGVPSRELLLVQHKRILDDIPEKEYVKRYGIGKRWWLENNDDLMQVLRSTKPPANQYLGTQKAQARRRVK